jgi:hypothetical protein
MAPVLWRCRSVRTLGNKSPSACRKSPPGNMSPTGALAAGTGLGLSPRAHSKR